VSCSEKVPGMRDLLAEALRSLTEELKTEALTHVSYANERDGRVPSNERLEFLGDAVISLAAALYLLKKYPDSPEGELTRMRASLVSGSSLAALALRAGLGDLLLLGRGEELTGGRRRPRNLAGAFEAVIGACFIQHGWDWARELVEKTVLADEPEEISRDPKTALQELIQRRPGAALEYRVVGVEGPDHMPTYTIALVIDGKEVSRGMGSSKKEAEESAAREALALNQRNGSL